MKVIFLDVDGVLNSNEVFKKRYEYFQKHNVLLSVFDEALVERLSEIVSATGAKVVLSSGCRSDWKNGVDNLELERSKELQELFNKYGIEVVGITPCIPRTYQQDEKYTSWRENEIKYYLDTHPDIECFCVIDDESFDLQSLEEYLVKTSKQYGLQEEHVEKAIKLLKKR